MTQPASPISRPSRPGSLPRPGSGSNTRPGSGSNARPGSTAEERGEDEFEQGLPGLSLVIPEVLALKPEDPLDRLVELIQQDAPLAAKVLAACNSPVLGLRQEVKAVSEAVMSLGLKAVRSLALCTAVIGAVGKGDAEAEKVAKLIKQSHIRCMRRAACARVLARHAEGSSDNEAFAAALLADLGRFWLLRRHPDSIAAIDTLVEAGEDVLRVERELTGEDHVVLGDRVARSWGLPESLREVIVGHHEPAKCKTDLVRLVHLADRAATIQEALVTQPEDEAELARLAHNWFGVERAELSETLRRAAEEGREAARALDLPPPPTTSYDVNRLSRELSDLHVDNERMVRELRESVRRAEQLYEALQQKVQLLDQAATTDDLTGLANRRATRIRIEQEHELASPERPTSLLLIDLDKFKAINDTYGHAAGDLALVQLARISKELTRSSDLVGRYGGDEFVVILPDADGDVARNVAERIRRKIESRPVKLKDGRRFPMQVSIGGCTLPLPGGDQGAALKLVDRALYAAKRLGRNQVVWLGEQLNEEAAA